MIISTTNSIDGYKITKYLGVVSAVNSPSNFVANISRSINESIVEDGIKSAISKLGNKARELGANAVVGVDIDIDAGSASFSICANGTAVCIDVIDAVPDELKF